MAPKKRRVEFDTYTPYEPPPSIAQTTSHLEQHTHYEPAQAGEDSYYDVPSLSTTEDVLVFPEQDDPNDLPMFDLPMLEDVDTTSSCGGDDDDIDIDFHGVDPSELEAVGLLSIADQISLGKATEDPQKQRRNRTQAVSCPSENLFPILTILQDRPLQMWTSHIALYVDELLRLEGLGDAQHQSTCARPACNMPVGAALPGYRCKDCQDLSLFCPGCIVSNHATMPLHRVEVRLAVQIFEVTSNNIITAQKWNTNFFERCHLKSLGLRIQLGHASPARCTNPVPAFNDDFTIIDSDGIHQVGLDFCGCQQAASPVVQLLRRRLFPATTIDPKTAATFRVLETFQLLSFSSKISGYEFYRSVARRTDNTGILPVPVSY